MSGRPLAWINQKVPSTILLIGLAVFFTWAALGERADLHFLAEYGRHANAVVVAQEGLGRYTTTTIEFESIRDGMVEVTLDEVTGPEDVGEEIAVVYDPDDPRFIVDARALDDPLVLYRWWFMVGLSGVLAALTGFGVVDWERWSKRR